MPDVDKAPTVIREDCGTTRGYNKHRRLKEQTCEQCRSANAADFRKKYAKNPQAERNRYQKNLKDPKYKSKRAEHQRRAGSRRRSRMRGLPQERYTEQEVLDVYGTDCHLCEKPIDLDAPRRTGWGKGWERGLQLDHLKPIAKGGSDTLANVRPSHALCNLSKGKKYAPPGEESVS
jgi:hypothetical protein